MAKLSIIFVHGFWAGPAHFNKAIVELASMGYASKKAVDMLQTSLADDAELTHKISSGSSPVLLVGHSYDGAASRK